MILISNQAAHRRKPTSFFNLPAPLSSRDTEHGFEHKALSHVITLMSNEEWAIDCSLRNRQQIPPHKIYEFWARQDICFFISLQKDVPVSWYRFLLSNCFCSLRAELGYYFLCLKALNICFASNANLSSDEHSSLRNLTLTLFRHNIGLVSHMLLQ